MIDEPLRVPFELIDEVSNMSSTHYENSNHSHRHKCSNGEFGGCGKGHWSGANIFAMVVGFVLFPPLGLIVLFWTLAGHPIQDLPSATRNKWQQFKSGNSRAERSPSGNTVFSEYQQTQYDRIREIKEEIGKRAERFTEFRSGAKRREDQEEFDRFMSDRPKNNDQ